MQKNPRKDEIYFEVPVCNYRKSVPDENKDAWDAIDETLSELDLDARSRLIKLLSLKLNEAQMINNPGSVERPPVFINVT